jgi:hypothetical protein
MIRGFQVGRKLDHRQRETVKGTSKKNLARHP